MKKALVIVESPAKCKKIAEFLGQGYQVLATMGHIRALEEDLDAVGLDRDFEPRFRFLKEKEKATKPILDAAKHADTIYLAADDDREGEAIAYSVACLLKKDPASLPRAVFHEITKKAVCDAVANPRRIDMNRVNAQQARAVLDMMVGFTISPLLWKHVASGLSAGRCQTPALRLVNDRESEIKGHSSQTTWALAGDFQAADFPFQARMADELEDQESAMNYMENVHEDNQATVVATDLRPWTSNPPKPLMTSTLQQEASALYKVNPKTTMKVAQSLYEGGHITYMRTDHTTMSEEAIQAAQAQVKLQFGELYVGDASAARAPAAVQKSKKKKEVQDVSGASPAEKPQAQEAHECIRPTHFELKELPQKESWTDLDKKIYTLIYRRAMQAVMSPARGQTRSVILNLAADSDTFPWQSSWKQTNFAGWQVLGQTANLDQEDQEDEKEDKMIWKQAMDLKQGQMLAWKTLQAAPKRTRPQPRFTEATLIRELEKKGIGRPSTFASLVEVLFEKKYVEKQDISGTKISQASLSLVPQQWPPLTKTTQLTLGAEKQKLVPTSLGQSVLTFCLREFAPLFAYEFTAKMEQALDQVAKGDMAWKQVCRDTWTSYKTDYERLKSKESVPSASEKVKDFGHGFKAVMSKTGPLLVQEEEGPSTATATRGKGKSKSKGNAKFFTFPTGHTFDTITADVARAWIQELQREASFGSWDGKAITKKKGPFGEYLQCGDLKIPYKPEDSMDEVYKKLRERTEHSGNAYIFGPYTFNKGQYGPYMYKTALKTKIFVSVPDSVNVRELTAEEADDLYKKGVEAKKSNAGRGGFRGRGGRGGNHGNR
jgi:DNA topoisomerase-1